MIDKLFYNFFRGIDWLFEKIDNTFKKKKEKISGKEW